eukprot:1499859-Rhodomonas_salina.1
MAQADRGRWGEEEGGQRGCCPAGSTIRFVSTGHSSTIHHTTRSGHCTACGSAASTTCCLSTGHCIAADNTIRGLSTRHRRASAQEDRYLSCFVWRRKRLREVREEGDEAWADGWGEEEEERP